MHIIFKIFSFLIVIAALFLWLPEEEINSYCKNNFNSSYYDINGRKISVKIINPQSKSDEADDIILIHGFPTSSYDFELVIPLLADSFKNHRIITHDLIGFGQSDKPTERYDYSVRSHADYCMLLWLRLNVTAAHIIAHDMGDSILTEIIYRLHIGILPSKLNGIFKSITFTNGGMRIEKVSFRLGQLILMNPVLNQLVSKIYSILPLRKITRMQLRQLWGNQSEDEVRECQLEQILKEIDLNNGWAIMTKAIRYIYDRYSMETDWLHAVQDTNIPCLLMWGDSDLVSPIELYNDLSNFLPKCRNILLKGVGHFPQLEAPKLWFDQIKQWIQQNN